MLSFLWDVGAFVVVLGILVTAHEFGHFWVARRCGVQVQRFSVGFGKALWRKVGKDGTEYVIALIPLGGYVKMLDGRVDELKEGEQAVAFDHQKVWKRMAIVAAGPIANFILAILAYWLVFMIGVPAVKPIVADVVPHSIAAKAGIQPGMEIVSIDGDETPSWEQVNLEIVSHIGESQMYLKARSAATQMPREFTLSLKDWKYNPDRDSAIDSLGFQPKLPQLLLELAQVLPNSPAAKAGLKEGDTLLAVNDKPLTKWSEFVTLVRDSASKPLDLTLRRQGEELSATLTPGVKQLGQQQVGFAGVVPVSKPLPKSDQVLIQYGPVQAFGVASQKTLDMVGLTLKMVGKLITGAVSVNNLGGPISIAKGAGASADYGFIYFLAFLALISVNLGIVNLLPLPVLDGGHLLFFIIEAVTGRPVPEKVQEYGFRIGIALLVCLMGIAILNDFARL
ncbi:sigma E protease regulator RseP [Dongshaea marina]|uniref:sigma E protease regulator RseP n=1 Tax=Dongshaea marina TaxID=2047966 RepID=UPI000D3EB502|nr:sigma E protease regulator RseP [Dongshaea marina]